MDDSLSAFELPRAMVAPALALFRTFNTAVDALFYDVPTLVKDLRALGSAVDTEGGAAAALGHLDLSALSNPEGALLVVDAAAAPYIQAFAEVEPFLAWLPTSGPALETVSITGVGSSALGSAALAWDLSKALKAPVLAIVPGYGLADAVLQGMGGWFGFGLHDALGTKARVQDALALAAPELAKVGRRLSATAPGAKPVVTGGPVFRTGSGSSDVLHDLLLSPRMTIRRLVGHSKGALAIGNALGSLDAAVVEGLTVVTLGCPIAEAFEGVAYHQYLGVFDALGQANAWGHPPDTWTATDHSTNPAFALSMDAGKLV